MSKRIEHLKAMIEQDPENPFPLYALGIEHMTVGDAEEACSCLLKARERFPDYIPTYYHLAQSYEALDEAERAKEVYQEGIQRASAQGEAHALSELKAAYALLADDV